MDAGVPVRPPQILFSVPASDGSALTYGLNGQFQMSPGSSSVQGAVVPHGDTDSSGKEASVAEELSTPLGSEAMTEQQATQSINHRIHPPESLLPFVSSFRTTPSPTRVPKLPVMTT